MDAPVGLLPCREKIVQAARDPHQSVARCEVYSMENARASHRRVMNSMATAEKRP